MKWFIRIGTHLAAVAVGFALGIYALPILIAPPSPEAQEVQAIAAVSDFTASFRRELADSDALHWGEGEVYIGPDSIALEGHLSPGPDYRLYLSPQFVETEADFEALKSQMVEVGPVRTFDNFTVSVPSGIDTTAYSAVIIWCETFGEFITAARYQ
ncbi:MAG: DM13 domain-containing protein [Pseudomonadota bacterium]